MFLEKYVSLDLYDEYFKKYSLLIMKNLNLIKEDGWILSGIHDEPNGSMSDHDFFCINKDLFDIIQSTHQEKNISLKIISNEPK